MGPYTTGRERPQVAGGRTNTIWKVAANTVYSIISGGALIRGDPLAWGLGGVLKTPHRKKNLTC